MKTRKRQKERDCYDSLRKRMLQIRRKRPIDIATSVALQLFAIFAALLSRTPASADGPADIFYSPPSPSSRATQRADTAQKLGVPIRYLELIQAQGKVPYAVLFNDIRRGGGPRRDAIIELRKCAPADSLRWLDHIHMYDEWTDLVRCFVPSGKDEDTDVKLLQSTLAWLREITPVQVAEAPVTVTANCTPNSTTDVSKDDLNPPVGPRP